MSEHIEYPPMPTLQEMVPAEAMLLWCMSQMGEFTLDKDAQTFTLPTPYSYTTDQLDVWEANIHQQMDNYRAQLPEGEDIPQNDYEEFMQCLQMIEETKTRLL